LIRKDGGQPGEKRKKKGERESLGRGGRGKKKIKRPEAIGGVSRGIEVLRKRITLVKG